MFQILVVRSRLLFPIAILALLLAACAPAVEPASPTSLPATPTETTNPVVPVNETGPEKTAVPTEPEKITINLDINGLAQNTRRESVPAVEKSDSAAGWAWLPEHERLTLEGYPVSREGAPAQVFIYPTENLASWNPQAGEQLEGLNALLASQQPGETLPMLPLGNDLMVMHAQVKLLDFKDGRGVRFLTQRNNGIAPINNAQLVYTYQGLTGDGRYYVAAVLPVTHPDLPADSLIGPIPTSDPFWTDHKGYLAGVGKTLDEATSDAFTPDLAKLDALIASLEVK